MDNGIKADQYPLLGPGSWRLRSGQTLLAQRCVLLLVFCTFTLGVQIIGDNKEVSAGQDVVLACKLVENRDEVLSVNWMRKTVKAAKENILTTMRGRDPTYEDVSGLKNRLQFNGNVQQGIGNVLLQNAQINDSGNYSCSFALYEGNSISKSIQLIVTVSPEVSMPTLAPLVGMTVVTLATCCVDNGYPPASVSWDFASLGNTVNVTTTALENQDETVNITSSLSGLPTRDINKKVVSCLVTHATFNGISISNYSINIEYAPMPAKVIQVESFGPSLTFQCEADANPEPDTYTWTRNGLPVSSSGVRANKSKLTLQTPTIDLNGLYGCEVSNKYGSATALLHFYIPQGREIGNASGCTALIVLFSLVVTALSLFICYRYRDVFVRWYAELFKADKSQRESAVPDEDTDAEVAMSLT